MTAASTVRPRSPAEFGDPAWARFLFRDPRASWIWLVVRVYLGYQWVTAGLEKIGSPAWTGANAGAALAGFANGALKQTGGDHPQVADWYASFLRSFVLPNSGAFSLLVAWGETLVGVALIVGAFAGIAAFLGIVMNSNYLLAGAISTNPLMILLGLLIVLAWRNAGWVGVDRFLLPAIGTPWQRGAVFERSGEASGDLRRRTADEQPA
jgi:thiosulfate dehydrogenase [quinone] large subunit